MNKQSNFWKLLLSMLLIIALKTPIAAQTPFVPNIDCLEKVANGPVVINWHPTGYTALCISNFDSYNIYVSDMPDGPFNLLTSITNQNQTSYTDNTAIPINTPRYYYLETVCFGESSPPSDTLDTLDPVTADILSVTVLNNTVVQVTWGNSASPETNFYIIYKKNINDEFVPYDTIPANPSFYQDTAATPLIQSEFYRIAAMDSCGNTGYFSPEHGSIFLTIDNDSCNNKLNFNWQPYTGWGNNGIKNYEIVDSITNTAIATLEPNVLSYTHNLPENQSKGCFYVIATNANGITNTHSNKVCVDIAKSKAPKYLCLSNISVINNDSIAISYQIDTTGIVSTVEILSGANIKTNLGKIYNYPFNTVFNSTMNYTDGKAEPTRYSYYYEVNHIDECNKTFTSNIGRTILLEGQDLLNFSNQLQWNAFELTFANIQNYTIYRKDNINNTYQPIATIDTSNRSYIDTVNAVVQGEQAPSYCYKIAANYTIECPTLSPLNNLSSFSNEVCIAQSSRIFVANAFAPNGINKEFKPIILYPNYNNYKMIILNRWGEHVFTTTNPDEGWNGMYKNSLAPQGVYVYYITMKSETGFLIERKGSVLLLR